MKTYFRSFISAAALALTFTSPLTGLVGAWASERGPITWTEKGAQFQGEVLYFPDAWKASIYTLAQSGRPLLLDLTPDSRGGYSLNRIPTLLSGREVLTGVLQKNGDQFTIQNQPIRFRHEASSKNEAGEIQNGTQIDEKTIRSFIGKELIAEGEKLADGTTEIRAMIPAQLFTSASSKNVAHEWDWDLFFSDEVSQNRFPIHETRWFGEPQEATPQEKVLILTLSGRQGDDAGAAGGHLSSGVATVQADQKLDGELFNVYVQNEKRIVPGNVSLTSYFGDLIGGQMNYRPTYTAVFYGLNPEKIDRIRELLDRYHPYFRRGGIPLSINFNCTTLTVRALGAVSVYGEHRNGDLEDYAVLTDRVRLFRPIEDMAGQLGYGMNTQGAEFLPRPAFINILDNIEYLNETEHLGIKRVDLFFTPQNESNKPRGGSPLANFWEAMRMKITKALSGMSDEEALRKNVK